MVDQHTYSFFGQSAGLTVQSNSKKEPYLFLKCIKKKPDGSWEKPSKGEGKTIKCNLEEIVSILRVLDQKVNEWSSYHAYNSSKTQISFNWEKGEEDKLWITIGEYRKLLNIVQVEVLRLLLNHIKKEKIKHSTIPAKNIKKSDSEPILCEEIYQEEPIHEAQDKFDEKKIASKEEDEKFLDIKRPNKSERESSQIQGLIKGETEKALLISFPSGQELWVPKSVFHSKNAPEKEKNQMLIIENWFLRKNKLIN